MSDANQKKCTHPSCECQVSGKEQYCSDVCRETASKPHGECDCGHADCVNTQETAA
jgi:hypothetical protein